MGKEGSSTAMGWDDAAMIGAQLVGGLFGGDDGAQERESFRNQRVSGVNVDPRNLQAQAKVGGEDLLSALLDWLGQDITMKTTAQPLPSFVGGGLPMAISAPGKDQAIGNPDILRTPGLQVQRRALDPRINERADSSSSNGLFGRVVQGSSEQGNALSNEVGGRSQPAPIPQQVPQQAPAAPGIASRFRPSVQQAQASGNGFEQAMAALKLLKVA